YMSGDDLSYSKLTADLLMSRLTILRDKLGSEGSRLTVGLIDCPDDRTLREWFDELYQLEKKADVTLWHPLQLVSGDAPALLDPGSGLRIQVESEDKRQQLLKAWHIRRWLVTMMSTAGHSQDTAINLVDVG